MNMFDVFSDAMIKSANGKGLSHLEVSVSYEYWIVLESLLFAALAASGNAVLLVAQALLLTMEAADSGTDSCG
jgi:hypothetical protein